MSEIASCANAAADEVVGEPAFFAPAPTDLLDRLIGQYNQARARVREVAALAESEGFRAVLSYFLEGNSSTDRGAASMSSSATERLFSEPGAVSALNSAYWSKALALTDVLDLMPQKRRDEWHVQISERKCPEFTPETVRATLRDLLNMRAQFFGERVAGIFHGLSGDHVTNAPEAFGKRMIVASVLDSYGSTNYSKCGVLNDLRCVVARFMGRDEPKHHSTAPLIAALKARWGQWVTIDGGALRVRLYMKGTAHIEVHPDMAWRLNQTLASIYPLAIPAQFRQKPKKSLKAFALLQRPLPFRVLDILAAMTPARVLSGGWPERWSTVPNAHQFGHIPSDGAARKEAETVLAALGGTKTERGWWSFDYDPAEVLNEVITSGCIPDRVAHQFYPTQERLGTLAADLAEIEEEHDVLEPSAGQGDLAAHLPKAQTTCVEISALHCAILRARGFATVQADFLSWVAPGLFDRVVLNPPYSEGRAKAHLEKAASLVKPGGRLVAILPGSMRGTEPLPGFAMRWSSAYADEFAGTSAVVAILVADRPR